MLPSRRRAHRPDVLESAAKGSRTRQRRTLDGSDPINVAVKMVRVELLRVKGELERQLARLVLLCRDCSRQVHWVPGVGSATHWAHREPAPHGEPAFSDSAIA